MAFHIKGILLKCHGGLCHAEETAIKLRVHNCY